jgi:hypothetical protein
VGRGACSHDNTRPDEAIRHYDTTPDGLNLLEKPQRYYGVLPPRAIGTAVSSTRLRTGPTTTTILFQHYILGHADRPKEKKARGRTKKENQAREKEKVREGVPDLRGIIADSVGSDPIHR